MTRRLIGVATAFLVVLLLPQRALAQGGTIRGQATDSAGAPIAGVQIALEGSARTAVTRSDGHFELRGVPAGTHVLRARGTGLALGAVPVGVAGGDLVGAPIVLTRVPVEVASLTVI